MSARAILVAAVVGAALATPVRALATPPAYVGAQFRYWDFSHGNDMRNYVAYWVPGPLHVQLEVWDFEQGPDQFRPEVGIHLRDARRSVYTLQWRHERRQERFWISTEQILAGPLVGRLEVSPIVATGRTDVVLAGGLDYYFGSYSFAQATLVRDPRDGGLWVLPLRLRLANESDDWIQVGVAPASKRTLGWDVSVKVRGVRAGVERNDRYDFTRLDNTIFTIGYEYALGGAR